MRNLTILLMIMVMAFGASASEFGAYQEGPRKTAPMGGYGFGSIMQDIDLASMTPLNISSLPFLDSGTTCGLVDDFDVACPNVSTSPDVAYVYTPVNDMVVSVDLCGSSYDTKTYILNSAMATVSCNDDYYMEAIPCGARVSKIEGAFLYGGETYYIVVDGSGGACGEYQVKVSEVVPCSVDCQPDAVPEGEPTLTDGYVDAHNGGCNSPEFGNPFQRIDWTNDDDGLPPYDGIAYLCGTSGWYLSSDGVNSRDTDWFVATALETGTMEFTVESEYPCKIAHINADDCNNLFGYQNTIVECGAPGTLTIPVTAGDEIHLWVGPLVFSGPVREFRYFGTLTNNMFDVVPVEEVSWGTLKSVFR